MKLYCCEACKYLFESNREEIVQCPDCGKLKIRPAYKEEIKEFQDRVLEDDGEGIQYNMGKYDARGEKERTVFKAKENA